MHVAGVVLVVALLSGCATAPVRTELASEQASTPRSPAAAPVAKPSPILPQQTVDEWADENYDALTGFAAAVIEANTAFENGINTNYIAAEAIRFRALADRLDFWLDACRALEPIPDATLEAEWQEGLRAMRDASSAIKYVAASEFATDLVLDAMDELNYAAAKFAEIEYLP
jgi:hypothetical protein